MNYELSYLGKLDTSEIIAKTPVAILDELETVGYAGTSKLIQGDNLPILKALDQDPNVSGKVKLIYIDPPYSTQRIFTGKSVWYQEGIDIDHNTKAYEDTLSNSEFLEFIRRRLIFLWRLLSDDGSIYLHLDDKMAFAVKVIMDEIFGPVNFRNWITRRKCSSKNYTRNRFGNITDYIMYYSKSSDPVWNRPFFPWTDEHAEIEYPRAESKTGRRFKPVPIFAQGVRNGKTGKPWRGMMPPKGKHWFTSPENLEKLDKEGRIYWSPNGNPRKKVYLDESPGVPFSDLWMNFRDAHNQNVSVTGYPTEKNFDMLKMIIQASSNPGDLVLDCFSGSGTTLEAASQLGRHWIGIDSSEIAIQTTVKRLTATVSNHQPTLFRQHENGFSILKTKYVSQEATTE